MSLLLPAFPVQSAGSFDVVINEIAWMGTKSSYNNEWIELYNNTNSAINLDNWVLKAVDGSPEVPLTGTIPAKGFYLLERSSDKSVPEISADQIYKGTLSNKGENLQLYDNLGNLIDSVDCSSGWIAGDNKTKQTMERTSNGWQTSQNPGGTPRAKNSIVRKTGTPPPPKVAKVDPPETTENLGTIGEQIPKSPLISLFVLLVASGTAIFSGIIILALKTKLKN